MSSVVYDGNGMRTAAAFTPAGGSTATGSYVWNGDRLLMDSANAYIYSDSLYVPAEQVSLATGTITYLVADALGSVRGTVNSAGALTGNTSYDAWGNPQTSGGLTAITPFGYAGGYTDPDGLIYFVNRYYDPATGQFTWGSNGVLGVDFGLSFGPRTAHVGVGMSYAWVNQFGCSGLWKKYYCPGPNLARFVWDYYCSNEIEDFAEGVILIARWYIKHEVWRLWST